MPKSIQFSLPEITHKKLEEFARDIGAVSENDRPKVATAVKQIVRRVIDLHTDAEVQTKVRKEGADTLSFILRCVYQSLDEEKK